MTETTGTSALVPGKVSIIMPAYNSEDCIARGIASCKRQRYALWELLIIDDGSTDGTLALAESYAQDDDRIRVMHQENAGVSTARNYGIELADGEYIACLDADDWLSDDALEIMVRLQSENPELLIACNRRMVQESEILGEQASNEAALSGAQAEADVAESEAEVPITRLTRTEALLNTGTQRYNNSSVNKIFRTQVIRENGIQFDTDLSYGEDGLFVFRYLLVSKGMLHYNRCLWNLLERTGSVTRRRVTERNLTCLTAIERMRAAVAGDGSGLSADETMQIDEALQAYGGSLTYNLYRRYIEGGSGEQHLEATLIEALRRYDDAYGKANDAGMVRKYRFMEHCPYALYSGIYRLTHR